MDTKGRGQGTSCAQHPSGRSGKRFLSLSLLAALLEGRWIWLLGPLSIGLQSVMFLGMNWSDQLTSWWILSFGCLVPWLIFLVQHPRARSVYLASYGLGAVFYWINTYYLWRLTAAGWFAMGIYFGTFYLVFAVVVRRAYLRCGLPLTYGVPLAWVACEFLRGLGPLSFPFLFLSHANYKQLLLIQISDLVGAYGVSFVVAMVNGLAADLLVAAWRQRCGRPSPRSRLWLCTSTLFVLAATLLYGALQVNRSTTTAGPRIAVLQGDYPLFVDSGRKTVSETQKAETYLDLMAQASAEKPDLYLFPETPWAMILNDEFLAKPDMDPKYKALQDWSRSCDKRLGDWARSQQAYVVIGAGSMEFFPTLVYPQTKKYNSAFVFGPRPNEKWRYDKVVLVMFGEYTPFRYGRLHALYRWLDSFNPFSSPDDEFSLTPGSAFGTFSMNDVRGGSHSFGIPICFEDLIPEVSRAFALHPDGRKRVDFLLGISNDGWFNHGCLVPQHLAICVFRAIENRVGIARAVNTACSGFIDPNGAIHHLVEQDGKVLGAGLFGYQVARVGIDSRRSLYSRFGDWFGVLCVLSSGVLVVLPQRRHGRQESLVPKSSHAAATRAVVKS